MDAKSCATQVAHGWAWSCQSAAMHAWTTCLVQRTVPRYLQDAGRVKSGLRCDIRPGLVTMKVNSERLNSIVFERGRQETCACT